MTRSKLSLRGRLSLLLVLGATLVAAGCGGDDAEDAPEGFESVSPQELTGKSFASTSVEGHELVPGTKITISFGPDFLAASAGCNSISGTYTFDEGVLEMGQGPKTQIGCPEDRHAQDEWLTGMLTSGVRTYSSGDQLVLMGSGSEIRLKEDAVPGSPPPVVGTTWELNSYEADGTVTSVNPGVRLPYLKFTENDKVEVFDGCNSGSGPVSVNEDGSMVFGPIALTRKACPGLTGQVSQAVQAVISGKASYAFEQQNLVISRKGQSITLTPA